MKGYRKTCKHRQFFFFGKCKFYKRECVMPCKFAKIKDKLKQGVDVTSGKVK